MIAGVDAGVAGVTLRADPANAPPLRADAGTAPPLRPAGRGPTASAWNPEEKLRGNAEAIVVADRLRPAVKSRRAKGREFDSANSAGWAIAERLPRVKFAVDRAA